MSRPRLLDLFCGAGGCSVGYSRAGFDVTGVDIEPHKDYPFELHVLDALAVLCGETDLDLGDFDVIHASPPCQRWSTATAAPARHPDLIAPVRAALKAWGGAWVIENVPQAPLHGPVILCGAAFGLPIKRHRAFESSELLLGNGCACSGRQVIGVYGDHHDRPGGWARPDGTSRGLKATSVAEAQRALGIGWMTSWDDLTDAIPPVYCEHIGAQLVAHLSELSREVP